MLKEKLFPSAKSVFHYSKKIASDALESSTVKRNVATEKFLGAKLAKSGFIL
jgi:hypothetical protein